VELGIIEFDELLLLALTFALGLASRSSNIGFLIIITSDSLALGELLGATLVGFADVLGGQ